LKTKDIYLLKKHHQSVSGKYPEKEVE